MSDFFARIWAIGDISPNAKFTLMAIARFTIVRGFCYANVKTISETTGFKARATRNHIIELEKAGLIKRRTRRRPDGSQGSNIIWLTLPEHVEPAMTPPERPDRDATLDLVDELTGGIGDAAPNASPPMQKMHAPPAPNGKGPHAENARVVEEQDSSEEEEETLMSDSDESDASGDEGEPPSSDSKESRGKAERTEANRVMEAVWEASSMYARKRGTREKTAEAALKAIKGGKVTGDELIAAWQAYTRSPDGSKSDGMYQKGPDRWIRNGLYEGWLEEIRAAAAPAAGEGSAGARDMGTNEEPTEFAQKIWMLSYTKRGTWRERQGPEPGEEGCRVTPEIQREYGVTPWEDRAK